MKSKECRIFAFVLLLFCLSGCKEIEPSNSTSSNSDSSASKSSETNPVAAEVESQEGKAIETSMKVKEGDFEGFMEDAKQHLHLNALSIEDNLSCKDWENLRQFENLTFLSIQETDCREPLLLEGQWPKITSIHIVLPPNQKTIPNSIFGLKTLTSLTIEGNDLQSIPNGIEKLANLEEIDFGISPISALPKVLGRLSKLQTIFLSQASNTQQLIQEFNKDFPHISIEIH